MLGIRRANLCTSPCGAFSGKRVVACRTAVNGWLPLTDSNLSTCKASHIRNNPAHLALKASTLPSLSFISLPVLLHALLLK